MNNNFVNEQNQFFKRNVPFTNEIQKKPNAPISSAQWAATCVSTLFFTFQHLNFVTLIPVVSTLYTGLPTKDKIIKTSGNS